MPNSSQCIKSTIRVAGVKMLACVEAQKKAQKTCGHTSDTNIDAFNNLETYLHGIPHDTIANDKVIEADMDKDNDGNEEGFIFNIGSGVCAVNIGNLDLAHIVNRSIGNPLKDCPFGYCFQKQKLINQWIKVGFLPMTYNTISDPWVRFEW